MKKILFTAFVIFAGVSAQASTALAPYDSSQLYQQLKTLANEGAIDVHSGPITVYGMPGDFIATKSRYCTHVESSPDENGVSDSYECKKL